MTEAPVAITGTSLAVTGIAVSVTGNGLSVMGRAFLITGRGFPVTGRALSVTGRGRSVMAKAFPATERRPPVFAGPAEVGTTMTNIQSRNSGLNTDAASSYSHRKCLFLKHKRAAVRRHSTACMNSHHRYNAHVGHLIATTEIRRQLTTNIAFYDALLLDWKDTA